MVESVEKCKRKSRISVDWYFIMKDLKNPNVEKDFCFYLKKLHRGKSMSIKRCAYYAILKNYSTTAIDELVRLYGVRKTPACN